MNIVFYNRDFTHRIAHNLDILVERYSHAMIGGPDKATFKVKPTADKWALLNLLRCPVEIYGDDGGLKWWGYVDRVTLPHGVNRVGRGLDEMYNSVTTKHLTGTLDASVEDWSVIEYGIKEFQINLSSAPENDAAIYQAIYIRKHKKPPQELELSGGSDEIAMECYGWFETLGWKYYTNTSETPIENTTQIRDIVAACGQFINGVIVNGLGIPMEWSNGEPLQWKNGESIDWSSGGEGSGITSTPTRDGSNTGLAYITELLNAGSVNIRPMLCYVDSNRWLHVYEQNAEATEYIMRDDGDLETILGKLVESEKCLTAVWVGMKGAPPNTIDPFFIERAEWVAGKVHYYAAGAFAQTRLDRYLQTHLTTVNGVPYVPPYVGYGGPPPIDTGETQVTATKAIVHDINYGPFFTSTLNNISPFWIRWNAGLTEEQYQIINRIKVCPNGAIYVGFCGADTRIFMATAPYLGAAFTVVEDYDSIHSKLGSPYDSRFGNFEVNPAEAEQVICAYNISGIDQMHMYIGSGTTWTGGAIFTTPFVCKISAGLDNWFITSSGNYFVLTGDSTTVIDSGTVFSYLVVDHARLGATNNTLHWGDGNLYAGYNYLTTYDTLDSSGVFPGISAISPDGFLILTNRVSAPPLQSTNTGAAFSEVSTLPSQNFAFDFIDGSGFDSQWLAASGAGGYIFYTDDFFQSDPVSKLGNMLDLVASPQFDIVKVLV